MSGSSDRFLAVVGALFILSALARYLEPSVGARYGQVFVALFMSVAVLAATQAALSGGVHLSIALSMAVPFSLLAGFLLRFRSLSIDPLTNLAIAAFLGLLAATLGRLVGMAVAVVGDRRRTPRTEP